MGSKRKEFLGARKDDVEHCRLPDHVSQSWTKYDLLPQTQCPKTSFFPLNKGTKFCRTRITEAQEIPWDKATWINKCFLSLGFFGDWVFLSTTYLFSSSTQSPLFGWVSVPPFCRQFHVRYFPGKSTASMPFLVLDFHGRSYRNSTNIWETNPNRWGFLRERLLMLQKSGRLHQPWLR